MSYLLCVDDNDIILQLVSKILEPTGHEIALAYDGAEALELINSREPDLIVLDLDMPRVSGYEVCRVIKGNPFTARIPILMLTAQVDIDNKIMGFEAGADDYLAKPFHPRELQARVDALLRLVQRESDRNPSSGLPGGRAIRREIDRRAAGDTPFAICYLDLDNFKPFADTFGFDVADSVIERTGTAICDAILEVSQDLSSATGAAHFAGHIGGDDFIIITDEASATRIAQESALRFRAVVTEILGEKTVAKGTFTGVDRDGRVSDFPIASLTSAILVIDPKNWISTAHIGAFAAEVKRNAKQQGPGSIAIKAA